MTTLANRVLRTPFFADFRLMDDLFNGVVGNGSRLTGWMPTLDIRETDDEYVVLVDLPGVKSEDVSIELVDQVLTISGTRMAWEHGDAVRTERPYGSFHRTLTLPQGVDADGIVADYQAGVLLLHVPKPAGQKRKKIAIGGGAQQQAIEA